MRYQLGLSAPNPDTRDFSEKSPLEPQKLRSNKMVCSVRKFCGFLRYFFKSALKQGPLTAVPIFFDNIKNAVYTAFFRTHCHLGFRPQNPTQGTFQRKVPWNFKSFYQSKMVCSVQSYLVYLSPKER